jgi:PKD repeat protein
MNHTYVYDTAADNGIYSPKITITTKKGLTGTIVPPYPITVKKKISTLHISIDSHPSQIARVGDKVDFSLELNGLPKTITWDFGNGKNLQCVSRQCVQASTVYSIPGRYDIKTTVTYPDKPSIEGTIALQVQ